MSDLSKFISNLSTSLFISTLDSGLLIKGKDGLPSIGEICSPSGSLMWGRLGGGDTNKLEDKGVIALTKG